MNGKSGDGDRGDYLADQEQVLGLGDVRELFTDPRLPFVDNVDDGAFDKDRRVDVIDLGLLVAQPSDEGVLVGSSSSPGSGARGLKSSRRISRLACL